MASTYLSRTPASAGNRKTWTFSAWLKRSYLITSRIFCTIASGIDDYIKFDTSDRIEWAFDHEDLTNRGKLITNRVFRDVSAWYHIICAVDTTNATAGNRMRIYINGVEETSFATDINPTLNEDGQISNANPHFLSSTSSAQFFDGYMSEVHFIDGSQLTPSSFGETNTGIWVPKKYSGSYGTNGFKLEFKNSSALGTDTSGNSNTFTVNNLTSIDQVTDTPENNFATLNPLIATGGTYAEGNLQWTSATTNGYWCWSSITPSSGGKWYCETKMISKATTYYQIGITTDAINSSTNRILYRSDGAIFIDSSNTNTFASYTTGDIIGLAYDASTLGLTIYKNGVSQGTVTATQTNNYYFGAVADSSGNSFVTQWNFGNPSFTIASGNSDANGYGNFEYAVPSGYYALNTKNLAEYG